MNKFTSLIFVFLIIICNLIINSSIIFAKNSEIIFTKIAEEIVEHEEIVIFKIKITNNSSISQNFVVKDTLSETTDGKIYGLNKGYLQYLSQGIRVNPKGSSTDSGYINELEGIKIYNVDPGSTVTITYHMKSNAENVRVNKSAVISTATLYYKDNMQKIDQFMIKTWLKKKLKEEVVKEEIIIYEDIMSEKVIFENNSFQKREDIVNPNLKPLSDNHLVRKMELTDALYDNAQHVFNAELLEFSCQNRQAKPFDGCEKQLRPSMQIECVGVFRVLAKIKGDYDPDTYLHIDFWTVASYSPSCPLDPTKHIFFKKGENLRIFVNQNKVKSFVYLDTKMSANKIMMPTADRVPTGKGFIDLDKGKCAELFTFFSWRGAITGYPDGSAKPYKEVNRAEFLTILTRSLGLQEEAEIMLNRYINKDIKNTNFGKFQTGIARDIGFDDVSGDKWYAPYVALGNEKNWIRGYNDGTFRPKKKITFVEALKIVLSAYEVPIITASEDNNLSWFDKYLRTVKRIPGVEILPVKKKMTRCDILDLIENVEKENLRNKMIEF